MAPIQGHIVVIGAGVIGLTSALQLRRKGYTVTIVARDLPGDLDINYASPWAGAHFRPIPVTNAKELEEHQFMEETYAEFLRLSVSDPSTGIEFMPGIEYFDSPPENYVNVKPELKFCTWPEFRVIPQNELPGQGKESIQWGADYKAWCVNTLVYLPWLMRQLTLRGVRVVRRNLYAVSEAIFAVRDELKMPDLEIEAVINASGMGFEDPATYPSRGQYILIANICDKTISYKSKDGASTVMIPRPLDGGTLVGGTTEPNNWSPQVSEAASASILERVSKLYPSLLQPPPSDPDGPPGLRVLSTSIGRRPMRTGGLRIEKETFPFVETETDGFKPKQTDLILVHCYGAGGSGYKISWGVANRVVEMVSK